MSQTHSNYINGVPVKISEKYKPPIKIQINQSLSQRLANVNSDIGQILATNYDTTLEKNVLMKLSEWQRVRQQENCDRKERVRCRQQEQQRHIEQKQKQMLTAVSYPSADDLLSDDEAEDSNESARTKKSYAGNESKPKIVSSTPGHFSPPNHFDNILIPTVIPEQLMNNRTTNALAPKFNKINYSDFENDTSSPFDNVELKTMNDLDILAQVLNITTKVADDKVKRAQNEDYNRKETVADFRGTHHSQHRDFSVQQQQPMTNSYYDQSQMNRNTSNYVSQSYSNEQHILPIRSITHQLTKYSNAINSSKTAKNDYVYHNGNEKCSPEQQLYQNNNVNIRNYNQGPNNKLTFQTQQSETQNKSKSVPDIVQELNNELKNSERKRIRNNSQSSVNTTSGKCSNCKPIANANICDILISFL